MNKMKIIVMSEKEQRILINSAVKKAFQNYQLSCITNDCKSKLISALEAQALLGCSATTLWRLRKQKQGGIHPIRLGTRKIAYNLNEIEEYIKNKK